MELKIYFEDKFVLLTDAKSIKKIENYYICENNSDILQALSTLKETDKQHVIIFNKDFNNLFDMFKSNFKYIEAAGGFIKNELDEYLFIFRRNAWDLPKGKAEVGETPEETAIREVTEETGLQQVTEKSFRCSTWHTYPLKDSIVLKQTFWYNMEASKAQNSKPQTEEDITELQWISKSDFSKVLENTFPSIIDVINHI